MTVYMIYGSDHRDLAERIDMFKEEMDKDAGAWRKHNSSNMYMCTRMDWDTVREYFKDYSSAVAVANNVEVPKACLASES